MSLNKGLFTSNTDLWETPQAFFDRYNAAYGFQTDVCALPENAKCERYFTPEQDGLAQDWTGVCWMNPPYGREIGKWVQKAYESTRDNGATVVCLLPARTDTAWFHDYIIPYAQTEFVRGRLKFGGATYNAPFPSVVAVFDGRSKNMLKRPNDTAKYPAYLRKIGEHAIADELEKRVEVVRCKDCAEYHEWLRGKICMRLGSYYGDTKPDDFCSYGHRREET